MTCMDVDVMVGAGEQDRCAVVNSRAFEDRRDIGARGAAGPNACELATAHSNKRTTLHIFLICLVFPAKIPLKNGFPRAQWLGHS
jgi:hypothetical protein